MATVAIDVRQSRVNELRSTQIALTAQIDELASRARAGDTNGVDAMSVLASEKSRVDTELASAETELNEAQEAQARAEEQARQERFEKVLPEARERREEFERLYRDCCLALGRYCASIDEATALSNSFANTAFGVPPHFTNAVKEVATKPNPLPALMERGLRTTQQFGWNFHIQVIPLFGE